LLPIALPSGAPSRGRPLWSRLLLLSPLIAALPVAAYAVVLFLGLRAERAADLRDDLRQAATALAAVVEAEIGAGTRTLEALAASPRLEAGDLGGFREEARRLLAVQPGWHTLALVGADRQVMNLRYPAEAALPPATEIPAGSVLQTGRTSVTVLPDGRVALRAPVRVDGGVRFALVAVMPGITLGNLLDRVGLPQRWSALLADEQGRVLARTAGSTLPATGFRRALAAPGQLQPLEGDWIGFARPVADTLWLAAVAAPQGTLLGTARAWLMAALGLTLLLAGLAISFAITLRQRRSEAQRQARITEDLARKAEMDRRRGELLATISHELRTPLSGLFGYTSLLAGSDLPAQARLWVDQQQKAGQALLALIDDVLDFARLEDGHIELEDADIDLPALLEDCAATLRSVSQGKGLTLQVMADPGLPRWVRGDPLRLRQVVTNLLGNAIKFTRDGGVTLSARLAGQPQQVELTVEDSGTGIPPDQLPFIFDRFRQASPDTARRFGGSGLGLAICRRLVMAMGGTITAGNRPAGGSRFAVRIPFRPGAAPPEPRGARLRILVAEDVPASRLLLSAVLERAGHEVTAAADGAQALAAMHGASFDMLLLDLNMPALDGFGVAAAVRTMPGEKGRVPLVALTADPPAEVEPRCHEAGFDAVLRKPFETRRLLGLIEALRTRPEPVGGGTARAAAL